MGSNSVVAVVATTGGGVVVGGTFPMVLVVEGAVEVVDHTEVNPNAFILIFLSILIMTIEIAKCEGFEAYLKS